MFASGCKHPHVFQPINIGTKRAKCRVEVAPAAPYLAGHDGALTDEYLEHIRALAASGAGVVTLGVTPVDPGCGVGGRVMNLGDDSFVSDFNTIAETAHAYGALMSAEMVYVQYMLSPADQVVNHTSTEEVEAMIAAFADGADRLRRAGFDMALVHGGHGNVPAMFFSQKINHRTDRFGGSFEGRCQFARELLQAIRDRVGNSIALEYRLSAEEMLPGTTTLEETLQFAKVIEPYIDLLHVSRGLLEVDELLPYINAPLYLPRALNLPYAAKFKEELDIPVTVVGSFDLDIAEDAISSGKVDMVSMVRTIYADTHCVEKARTGHPETIRQCIRCNTCIDRTHNHFLSVRCAVNPILGRESRFGDIEKDSRSLHVAIIGGGVSGMEAARTCSARGFKPTIYEKTGNLGGLLRLAAEDEMKHEIKSYLDWLIADVENNPDIEIRYNTEATPDMIAAENPDAVLLACGCDPIIPTWDPCEGTKVVWAGDAHSQATDLGDEILVAGMGMTGMELALSLVRSGKKVKLVGNCSYESAGAGATAINVNSIKTLLSEAGVEFICEQNVDGVTQEGVLLHDMNDGAGRVLECDTVILSFGFQPNAEMLASFENTFVNCTRIGDCAGAPANVFHATQTAFDRVMAL